jgi:tRNA G18 (ribose-2'-O)-methylase SpoU
VAKPPQPFWFFGETKNKIIKYTYFMPEIIVIIHNIRSTYNVGSIFRTCEGFGVTKIILSGYSPYPKTKNDARLPHISSKLTAQIHKTALGAEAMVPFEYRTQLDPTTLRAEGYRIVGLEQDNRAVQLADYPVPDKLALILGEEVEGIDNALRDMCDDLIEIPMHGKKESFNVSVATGIALYHLRTCS